MSMKYGAQFVGGPLDGVIKDLTSEDEFSVADPRTNGQAWTYRHTGERTLMGDVLYELVDHVHAQWRSLCLEDQEAVKAAVATEG